MNPSPAPGPEIVLYVAPEGDDHNPGTAEAPFATPARARDVVRGIKCDQGLNAPITVRLRSGKYFLAEPLVLTGEDSGTQDCPVTYAACTGEQAVLSGGRRIVDWKPYQGSIFRTELLGARGGKWGFRQLFCNGQRQQRARWPKPDPADPLYSGWALTEGPAHENSTDAFVYKPGTFRHVWAKPTEVEVVYWASIGGWNSRVPIARLDPDRRVIALAHAGWQFDVPGWYMPVYFGVDNRFYVENALEELTEPGEWCFDSEEGVVYFWPPTPAIEHLEVVVPALDCLVDVRGACWVNLCGLTYTETTDGDNFHREGVQGTGAMYPRPGWRYCGDAVHLKDAEHCRIEDCTFHQVGGNAVYLEGHNTRNAVTGNHVDGAGANGVCLLGTRLRHPRFNEVRDNYIHHCGVICKYTAGIFSGMSDGNVISHNRLEHLPHHAINLSNSPHGRNFVEHNRIRWVDEEVADSAAVNCWMEDPPDPRVERCGHIIRFNLITDVYGCEVTDGKVGPSQRFPTSGIYLDNYTSNCTIYGNILARCTHAGVLVHAGKNNLIENNLIVDCLHSIRFQDYVSGMEYWRGMSGFMTGNHVLRNLCVHTGARGYAFGLHAWTDRVVAQSDYNLFFRTGDRGSGVENFDTQEILSVGQWQRLGYDAHSLTVDPLLMGLEGEEYQLRPESPAFELGFQPLAVPRTRWDRPAHR
jgi:parallel beta-helix repeat protein